MSYYIDNKQVKKSLGTDNERIAKSKLKKLEYDLALGDLHVASKLPTSTILEAFCRELKATRTFKSYKNDFSRLRVFFGPICSLLKPGTPGPKKNKKTNGYSTVDRYAGKHVIAAHLEDISSQVINRFIAARIQEDAWSPKSANLMREILHKFFSYAIKHHGFQSRDRRHSNPAGGVERKRVPAQQIRFLQLEEIDIQLDVLAECSLIGAMVATYIYAGLRREEALWLTHEDVDFKGKLIRVQAKTIGSEFWQPKTKRNRAVPMSKKLHEILKNYVPPRNCAWFFPSPRGKRWNPDNFSQDLREINRKADLDWSCLDFRHTFGSHLAQKGESLFKIAELMGNSPAICRKHYAALMPERMFNTVEFEEPAVANPAPQVEAMFEKILNKLDDGDDKKPKLRLLRF